jgi:hypothetical protein
MQSECFRVHQIPLSIPVNLKATILLIAGVGVLRLVRRGGLAQDHTSGDVQGRFSRRLELERRSRRPGTSDDALHINVESRAD